MSGAVQLPSLYALTVWTETTSAVTQPVAHRHAEMLRLSCRVIGLHSEARYFHLTLQNPLVNICTTMCNTNSPGSPPTKCPVYTELEGGYVCWILQAAMWYRETGRSSAFLSHVSARLGHHQGEYLKHKAEATSALHSNYTVKPPDTVQLYINILPKYTKAYKTCQCPQSLSSSVPTVG
jgi:hypothetical protein